MDRDDEDKADGPDEDKHGGGAFDADAAWDSLGGNEPYHDYSVEEQVLLRAFPNEMVMRRHRAFRRNLALGQSADYDWKYTAGVDNPEEWAEDIFREVHKLLAANRDRTSRVKFSTFNLQITYGGMTPYKSKHKRTGWYKIFRFMNLGSFSREDIRDNHDAIYTAMIAQLIAMGDQYGELFKLTTYRIKLTNIAAELYGECKANNIKIVDEKTGIMLQQVKASVGMCGLASVYARLKKMKSLLDQNKYNGIKTRILAGSLVYSITGVCKEDKVGWTAMELEIVCNHVNVNLLIYDVDDLLGPPIFGVPGRASIGCISLAHCKSTSVYSQGECGHYLVILDTHKHCEKCGEVVDRTKVKRHVCSRTCEYCDEEVKYNVIGHDCRQKAIQERKDVNTFAKTSSMRQYEMDMIQQVDDIVEGKIDDAEVIDQWKQQVYSGMNTCLLGDAGTGKTFNVIDVCTYLLDSGKFEADEIVIMGAEAVGVSSYRVALEPRGVKIGTSHNCLGWQAGKNPSKVGASIRDDPKKIIMKERISKYKLIIIDEVGCTSTDGGSADHLNSINLIIQLASERNELFGGAQILLTGDFRQRQGLQCKIPIFLSELWSRMNMSTCTLFKQHRVKHMTPENKRYLKIQMWISRGVCSNDELEWFNEQCSTEVQPAHSSETVHLMMTNEDVYQKGKEVIEALYGLAYKSFPVQTSDRSEYKGNVSMVKCDPVLRVRPGVPVMFTTNECIDQPGSPCNGTVGKVHHFTADEIVVVLEDGNLISVKRKKCSKKGSSQEGYQFNLRLAYARTIHKSQGATFPRVVVWLPKDASKMSVALAYVAISRTRDIKHLTMIGRLSNRHITVCARSVMYMQLIQKHSYSICNTIIRQYFGDRSSGVYMLHPYNMQTVSMYIDITNKSVADPESSIALGMYSRAEREEIMKKSTGDIKGKEKHQYLQNFSDVIYFDFETAPGKHEQHIPYHVVAHYWDGYVLTEQLNYGIKAEGGCEDISVIETFVEWVMKIAMKQTAKWQESDYKKHRSPIRLIAYNGSGFDFQFIKNYLQFKGQWNNLEFSMSHKNSSIIRMDVSMKVGFKEKELLTVWDPYLLISERLDDAHESFCPEEHKTMQKDCFPHNWVSKVGAKEAFKENADRELVIASAFPDSMRKIVERRITSGSLLEGSHPGTVLFNPVKEMLSYVVQDVVMLEDVVESFSLTVWNKILPDMMIPIFKFPTASSFGFAATILLLEEQHQHITADSMKKGRIVSRLHRLNKRLDAYSRSSTFGGKTLNRATAFLSQERDEILRKIATGTMTAEEYDKIEDCMMYIDRVGMYHEIAKNREFPFEKEIELVLRGDVENFFKEFMKDPNNEKFPMFMMRLDVYPPQGEVESFLPGREKEGGRLLWSNKVKYDQWYNSVHLVHALKRGYVIKNPQHVIAWGTMNAQTGEWTGNRATLFRQSSMKWEEMRLQGGAVKTCAKLISNSGCFGAMLKRDFHNEIEFYNAQPGEVCGKYNKYLDKARDSKYKIKYEVNTVREDGGACKTVEWESIPGDDYICTRASYIGSFILAYAHVAIDETIETLLGADRRNGCKTNQINNGDTDSLMVHVKHIKGKDIKFHTTDLGSYNDDLAKYYGKPKTVQYSALTGLPIFAKIIKQANPAKKCYAMEVVLPDGTLKLIDPKTKGIAKGRNNHIMTGEERDLMLWDKVDYSVPMNKKKRKEVEREVIDAYLDTCETNNELTADMIFDSIDNRQYGGIVATSTNMRKVGPKPSLSDVARGVEAYGIYKIRKTRHILRDGATLPPERVPIPGFADEWNQFSVPDGYVDPLL